MSAPGTASAEADLCYTSAVDLAGAIRRREISPVEITAAVLGRIEAHNGSLNAFVTVRHDEALAEARAAEDAVMTTPAEDLPPLHGIPVTVKDLENTAGVRTTYGSKLWADNVPDTDAPIWARLRRGGGILIGKTTTPEFGMHTVTESNLTGVTNNPWDVRLTPGGSSGGAAAAVAAGFGPLATGSDGGGSIRVPASFCGVVGLKASAGRIPFNTRESAYETVTVTGPMTRTVTDAALMLSVTAGPDPFDAISLLESNVDYVEAIRNPSIAGLRVAYSPDLGSGPVDAETARVVRAAVGLFESVLGARVDQVTPDLPDPIKYFSEWWAPFITMEFEDLILALGTREDSHPVVQEFVERSEGQRAVDFARTQMQTRTRIHTGFADVFMAHDLLVWPTTPTPAFAHPGPAGGPLTVAGVPVREPSIDNQRLTEAIAHAGYPAISIPAGYTVEGLPVGLQIAAGHGQDALVLRAAHAFEEIAPWATHRPF